MARRTIPSVAADFASVMDLLSHSVILEKPYPGNLEIHARRIHSSTYSLILWRFRLRRIPVRGKVFIDEIASDALQVLPQVVMGYGKTVTLLTRGIIENTLRHIYFMDHPVEFDRMNRDRKWYITIDALFEYIKLLPPFPETEKRFDAINKMSSMYSGLSATVHGRTVDDLETRVALAKIQYHEGRGREHAAMVQKCAGCANFLLAMFHRVRLRRFQEEDRRIILRAMPARAREIWSTHGI